MVLHLRLQEQKKTRERDVWKVGMNRQSVYNTKITATPPRVRCTASQSVKCKVPLWGPIHVPRSWLKLPYSSTIPILKTREVYPRRSWDTMRYLTTVCGAPYIRPTWNSAHEANPTGWMDWRDPNKSGLWNCGMTPPTIAKRIAWWCCVDPRVADPLLCLSFVALLVGAQPHRWICESVFCICNGVGWDDCGRTHSFLDTFALERK